MASAHSLSGVMKWLQRDEWREPFDALLALHLQAPCDNAEIAIEDLPDVIGDERMSVLWGWVFEDFLARNLEDGRNIADDYLKRRGWNEKLPNKRYLAALRTSKMSLYEISDIVRDQGFLARDLVRGGEPVRISEKMGTHSLKQWDRLAVRIVQLGSRNEMSGGALRFDHRQSEMLLSSLRKAHKNAKSATLDEILRSSADLFTRLWLDDALQQTLHPSLPRLFNSDGDEIMWTTSRYSLSAGTGFEAIGRALAVIRSLRAEGETFWNWVDGTARSGKKLPADAQTSITTLEDGATVLGTIEVKDGALILEANSPQRAERGRALLAPILGDLVGKPTVKSTTTAELMASRPAQGSRDLSSGLSPEEEREVLRAYLERHYESLLDEKVAILGNVTPRQAAKSTKGRAKLAEWLKILENGAAKDVSAAGGYDFGWMWHELGIAHLRR